MAERDIIRMSQKEMKRLHVIHKVREGLLKQKQAAEKEMGSGLAI
jgi:hypothetical protein